MLLHEVLLIKSVFALTLHRVIDTRYSDRSSSSSSSSSSSRPSSSTSTALYIVQFLVEIEIWNVSVGEGKMPHLHAFERIKISPAVLFRSSGDGDSESTIAEGRSFVCCRWNTEFRCGSWLQSTTVDARDRAEWPPAGRSEQNHGDSGRQAHANLHWILSLIRSRCSSLKKRTRMFATTTVKIFTMS